MIKRKFKVNKKDPAKRIDQMDKAELIKLRDYATFMANAAGYADDGRMQNWWISVECECTYAIRNFK
jgi:hypothetical protein